MKRTLALLALVAAGCGLSSGGRSGGAPSDDDADFTYDVTVSDDLARIDVRLALRGSAPRRLSLGDAEGLAYMTTPVAAWRGETRSLAKDDTSFVLSDVGRDAVVSWHTDLTRMAEDRKATRVGRSICVRPGMWLLRPYLADGEGRAALSLHLPDGVGVTVPWPMRPDGRYLLDSTTFRWRGFAAFGRIESHTIDIAGAHLRVGILDRPHAVAWPGIESWITAAARAQTSLYGEFPAKHAQIVVKPVSSNDAVPFGETQRGGGRAVVLYVGDDAKDADFARDWVAVHEFAHLGMPAMPEADAWLAEGFIQYYTEVLMGRSGLYDERRAWDETFAGFARGRRDGRGVNLAQASESMGRTHAFMRVYWGGAAIALLLDVELRRSSGGTKSLDDAIRETRRTFTARPLEASADEILTHLDKWLGRPLFTDTARKWLASMEFPAVEETLTRLGVVVKHGDVTGFDESAPDAAIRRAIMGK